MCQVFLASIASFSPDSHRSFFKPSIKLALHAHSWVRHCLHTFFMNSSLQLIESYIESSCTDSFNSPNWQRGSPHTDDSIWTASTSRVPAATGPGSSLSRGLSTPNWTFSRVRVRIAKHTRSVARPRPSCGRPAIVSGLGGGHRRRTRRNIEQERSEKAAHRRHSAMTISTRISRTMITSSSSAR